jgi:hypothetical protein
MANVRLIKHEVIPQCGSFEVRYSDGRPSYGMTCRAAVSGGGGAGPPRGRVESVDLARLTSRRHQVDSQMSFQPIAQRKAGSMRLSIGLVLLGCVMCCGTR